MTNLIYKLKAMGKTHIDPDLQDKFCSTAIDGTPIDPALIDDAECPEFDCYAARARGYNRGADNENARLQPLLALGLEAIALIEKGTKENSFNMPSMVVGMAKVLASARELAGKDGG